MKITDTERLDWLEKEGNGLGLIHDDMGFWAIGFDGMQNISLKPPVELNTTYFIPKKDFRSTIRAAIDLAIKRDRREKEKAKPKGKKK